MNGRMLTTLTILAGVLGVGEFGSALMIWLEDYPDSVPAIAVVFGVLFFLGAWLLRSGRVRAGAIFVGILCLVEVIGFPGWTRHNAGDWVYQTSYAVVSLAGLIVAIALFAARWRSPAVKA